MTSHARSLKRANKARSQARTSLSNLVNIPVLVSTLLLIAYGALVIWAASITLSDASFLRHLLGIALGLAFATLIAHIDFQGLAGMSTTLLILDLIVIFLPYVPGISTTSHGMTGWITIPLVNLTFQPVEAAKPITALLLAAYGAQYHGHIDTVKDYVRLCAMLALPFAAIILAGDLGSALVIFAGGVVLICMSGPKKEWVLLSAAVLAGLVSLLLAADSVFDSLLGQDVLIKQYQMNRLLVFIDPTSADSDTAYNLMQSLIAVGSGGFFGKGIGNATQSGQGFLPEAHTDFVFALLSETFGFLGALLLLVLYAALIFSTIRVIIKSDSLYLKLVGAGIVGMWTFQIFENIGMCIGLMPITGIPLPFISFGSSSMIMQCAMVGIIQSIWRRSSSVSSI